MMFVVGVKTRNVGHGYVGPDGGVGSVTVAQRFATYAEAETEAERWRSPSRAAWAEEVPCRKHGLEDCPRASCHRTELHWPVGRRGNVGRES